jgi:hypothetical protein
LLAHPPAPDDDVILTTKVMLARAHLDHNPSNNRSAAISKPIVNAVTCYMTAKSIAAGNELPFERKMLWAIYFSGAFQFNLGGL